MPKIVFASAARSVVSPISCIRLTVRAKISSRDMSFNSFVEMPSFSKLAAALSLPEVALSTRLVSDLKPAPIDSMSAPDWLKT